MWSELGLTTTEAVLTVVTATGIYFAVIALSRLFGQRQFASSTTYDLAFLFAVGSVIGRVVLVRTSLATALLGLGVLFVLHTGANLLHHEVGWLHNVLQNPPVLVVADGEIVPDGMRRAHLSDYELFQALRQSGRGSLDGIQAAILERNGELSIIEQDTRLTPEVLKEVVGRERLAGLDEPAGR